MILGLTGAIGGGKSAALAAFSSLGANVLDADRLCHRYYDEPDSPIMLALKNRWGAQILLPDGRADRRKIGEIVFRDPVELEFLTSQLYPVLELEIRREIRESNANPERLTVIEIPLLFECGWEREFDATVAVWTEPALRHARLRKRGLDEAEIARREEKQWSDFDKLERADYGLINNGDPDLLIQQCNILIEQMKRNIK